jgi:ABC-type glycerol-3-phosphate transport system substrate-binding protein
MSHRRLAAVALAAALGFVACGAAAAAPVTVTLVRWPYT